MEKKEIKDSGEEEVKQVPQASQVQIEKVATETQEVFSVNGELMNINNYLCWMGNLLIRINKGVSG